MSLEQKVKKHPKLVVQKTPPAKVLDEIKKGKKFVIVDDDFHQSLIPLGYMLIDTRHEGESFKTLVPQNLLYFLANPGEGDVDDALDEIADFYREVEDYEDERLEENGTSVQGTNWAVTARQANHSFLAHKISLPRIVEEVFNKGGNIDKIFSVKNGYKKTQVTAESGKEVIIYHPLEDYVSKLTISDRLVQKSQQQIVKESFGYIKTINGSVILLMVNNRDMDDIVEDSEQIHLLNLDDEYVVRRVKAIAVLCLGKTSEADLKKYDLGEVVRHVIINERKVEQLSREEFDQVTCWAGSHYDIKEEYRNKPDVEYRIDRVHDTSYKVGEKISHKREALVLDSRVDGLEKEIDDYRVKKNGSVGRHDRMLLRMYINLNYVAKENAQKQLEVKPDTLASFKKMKGGDVE